MHTIGLLSTKNLFCSRSPLNQFYFFYLTPIFTKVLYFFLSSRQCNGKALTGVDLFTWHLIGGWINTRKMTKVGTQITNLCKNMSMQVLLGCYSVYFNRGVQD